MSKRPTPHYGDKSSLRDKIRFFAVELFTGLILAIIVGFVILAVLDGVIDPQPARTPVESIIEALPATTPAKK